MSDSFLFQTYAEFYLPVSFFTLPIVMLRLSTSPKLGQRIIRHKTLILRNEKEQTHGITGGQNHNQLEQGITADVVCREYGVSRGTLYN